MVFNDSTGTSVHVRKLGKLLKECQDRWGVPVPSFQYTADKSDTSGQSSHHKACQRLEAGITEGLTMAVLNYVTKNKNLLALSSVSFSSSLIVLS